MKILIASFGFDIDFVARRLVGERYNYIILIALKTDEKTYRRVEKAYHALATLCDASNIRCQLETVEPGAIVKKILSILNTYNREDTDIELYLTGGPRIIVVLTLLSALLSTSDLLKKIKIVVEGEAFEYSIRIDPRLLKKLIELDDIGKNIINILAMEGETSFAELQRKIGIPKSTLHRKLTRLINEGLIEKTDGKYRLSSETYNLFTL